MALVFTGGGFLELLLEELVELAELRDVFAALNDGVVVDEVGVRVLDDRDVAAVVFRGDRGVQVLVLAHHEGDLLDELAAAARREAAVVVEERGQDERVVLPARLFLAGAAQQVLALVELAQDPLRVVLLLLRERLAV